MLNGHLLKSLRLRRPRSGTKQLVDDRASHSGDAFHDLAIGKLSNDLLDKLAKVTTLGREDVDGSTTTDDIADLQKLVVISAVSKDGSVPFVVNL